MNQFATPTTERTPQLTKLLGSIRMIPIDRVVPDPGQPRKYFDEVVLAHFADGVEAIGQLMPIIVVPFEASDEADYQIVDGERRWRAMRMRESTEIRAFVAKNIRSAEQAFMFSIAANFNREEHTPMEIARSIERLKHDGLSGKEIEVLTGKSVYWIHSYYRLLKLHPDVVKYIDPALPAENRMKLQIARLLTECDHKVQQLVAHRLIGQRISVARASKIIDEVNEKHGGRIPQRQQPARRFQRVNRLAENTLASLTDLNPRKLREAIASRSNEEVEQLKTHCERISEQAMNIADVAGEVLERKGSRRGNGDS
ncbi:MAG: ParB/RepB/Spo0J family partition protein [Candidatus Paceibacterota bacterium]